MTGVEAVLADGRGHRQRLEQAAQGQHRLRREGPFHRRRRNARNLSLAASLRLFPNPRAQATAFVGLKSPDDALKLLRIARERLGAAITSFRAHQPQRLRHLEFDIGGARAPLRGAHDWYILIEAFHRSSPSGLDDAFAGALEAALEQGASLKTRFPIAASLEQRADFWQLRECLSDAQSKEGGSITARRCSRSRSASMPTLIRVATPAVEAFEPGARVVAFGHLGDGNIHFNPCPQPVGRADKQSFSRSLGCDERRSCTESSRASAARIPLSMA